MHSNLATYRSNCLCIGVLLDLPPSRIFSIGNPNITVLLCSLDRGLTWVRLNIGVLPWNHCTPLVVPASAIFIPMKFVQMLSLMQALSNTVPGCIDEATTRDSSYSSTRVHVLAEKASASYVWRALPANYNWNKRVKRNFIAFLHANVSDGSGLLVFLQTLQWRSSCTR